MTSSDRSGDRGVCVRPSHVKPLEALPVGMQADIARLVAEPTPPAKWRTFGVDGRPLAQIVSRAWHEWHWQRGVDPDKRRQPLSPTLRVLVIKRDGYVCQLCGGEVEPSDVHIDHIYPRSKGGKDVLDNLQVAHSLCNIRKGARI